MTREQIVAEFHRRCEIVNQAEEEDLLDRDEAQAMRDRYRTEADEQLSAILEGVES